MFTGISIGWEYGWWFPVVYVVVTLGIMTGYGKDFTRRFLSL